MADILRTGPSGTGAPDTGAPDTGARDTGAPDTGAARRTRRALVAALLCGVSATAALACPGVASAAPGQASAAVAGSVLPGLAEGLQLHTGMMPADSPDAAPGRAAAATAATAAAVSAAGGADSASTDVAAGTAATAAAAAATTTWGLDIASYQHPNGQAINWGAVAASGSAFAVVKATESGYTNPWLGKDIAAAHAAGLVVGAYAFARPAYSATAQADAFATAIGRLPSPSLPPVLDLEDAGGLTPSQLISWTRTFLDRLQADTGRVPMIYSGPYFWRTAMAGSTAFTRYPLWEAQYTTAGAPNSMGGWPTYTLWQYSSTGSVPGVAGAVDRDRFEGTKAQLGGAVTPAPSPLAPNAINDKHAALGGDAGLLGPATSAESDTSAPGGRLRYYARGAIYWSPTTGAHELHGALFAQFTALGGTNTPLRLPTTDEAAVPGGRGNTFQGGALYWSAPTGAHAVLGAVGARYFALGGPAGLGLPTADEADAPGGRVGAFQSGRVYWSAGTGAHEVRGAILTAYDRVGGASGMLGLPRTGEGDVTGGRRSTFAGGEVLWSVATGAHEVHGAIRDQYDAVGGPAAMGLPTADESAELGGRRSTFSRGRVYWSPATGARAVWGAIGYRYLQDGGAARYGFPVTPEQVTSHGARQQFQQVVISYDSTTRSTSVSTH